jgi:hypothetical protein
LAKPILLISKLKAINQQANQKEKKVMRDIYLSQAVKITLAIQSKGKNLIQNNHFLNKSSRGDVPGWVLVVLMTTALVTGIWSIAAPKLTTILRNSLDAMGGIK